MEPTKQRRLVYAMTALPILSFYCWLGFNTGGGAGVYVASTNLWIIAAMGICLASVVCTLIWLARTGRFSATVAMIGAASGLVAVPVSELLLPAISLITVPCASMEFTGTITDVTCHYPSGLGPTGAVIVGIAAGAACCIALLSCNRSSQKAVL